MNGDTAGHDPEPISSTASATPSHQATNWQIADYRMIRKIGEGGMGVVFEAEQQHPKRPVALKVIPMSPHRSTRSRTRWFDCAAEHSED